MSEKAVVLTEQTFESEVKKGKGLVLVDFWASWCGPCRMLSPTVEKLAEDLAGKLKVCKVNVDEVESVAAQYGIMSIPTLLLFKDGEVVDKSVGVVSYEKLVEMVNKRSI